MKSKPENISYIPINRSFFNHFLWKENRTFSKCEAWLDLIQQARFEQSEAKELMGGKLIKWNRGQVPASVRFLAERWNWGKHKVEAFIKLLKDEKMISTDSTQGQQIITLLNYSLHNGGKPDAGQRRGQQKPPPQSITEESGDSKGDNQGTEAGQAGDKTNKENNDNNEEKDDSADAPPPKSFKNFSEQDFVDELKNFKNDFPYEILNSFFKYWKEKDSKGKMKFQKESTWETKLRLERWQANQEKFDKNGSHRQSHSKASVSAVGRTIEFDKP